MSFVAISLGIIILLLIYFLYTTYWKISTLLDKANLNKEAPNFGTDKLANINSANYAYGIWIYVNTWSNSNKKYILTHGTVPSVDGTPDYNFSLYIDQTNPILYFHSTTSAKTIPITTNFPIQKWTSVIVSINGKIVDFYLDGKLVLSTKIDNIIVPTQPLNIGNEKLINKEGNLMDIYLARLVRWTSAVDPQTAWNSLLRGPGVKISKPNVQVSILQNDVETSKIKIF